MADGRWHLFIKQELWDLSGCWENHTAGVRSCLCALISYFLRTKKLLPFGATCRKKMNLAKEKQ